MTSQPESLGNAKRRYTRFGAAVRVLSLETRSARDSPTVVRLQKQLGNS